MTLVDNLRVIAGAAPDGRLNSDVKEFMVRMKEGGRAASTDELLSMMRGFKDNVALRVGRVAQHPPHTALLSGQGRALREGEPLPAATGPLHPARGRAASTHGLS